MAAIRKHVQESAPLPAPTVGGSVAAGGPVEAMQRDLRERLAAVAEVEAWPEPSSDRIVRFASRAAGPLALLVAYFATARFLLG